MNLEEARNEINEINKQMLELFQKRMDCSFAVAEYKKANGMAIFDGAREQKILDTVHDMADEKYKSYARDFFQSIMDVSRDYQAELLCDKTAAPTPVYADDIDPSCIVFQGVDGSYSSEVVYQCFNDKESINVQTFEDVFKKVMQTDGAFGILPIENSSTGAITEIYSLLTKYDVYISAEKVVKIDHNLLGIPSARIEDIEEIYSHPQAFMQSSEYLDTLNSVKQIPYYNTAISAKKIAGLGNKKCAAIGSRTAARLYGLDVLRENINNNTNNFTRFIIVSKEMIIPKNAEKVSVMFAVPHESGALMRCLRAFAKKELNLIRLESRPHPEKAWQYMFFADFEGDFNKLDISDILPYIMQETLDFKFLGNYKTL